MNNVFIIAEIGVNHCGKLSIAKKLIDKAKWSGADAVKFQTYKTKDLVAKCSPQYKLLKELELPYKDFVTLKKYCDKVGIEFMSTPHTEDAIDFLEPLVKQYKIASGDVTNMPFLEKIARKGKPIILSTGMANMSEIRKAVKTILIYNKQLGLLHCTTSYPCPREDANLFMINTLRNQFNLPVGFSDHTKGIESAIESVFSFNAVIIEKHLTLSRMIKGPDHKSSLEPTEFKLMVDGIRNTLYLEKKITNTELGLSFLVRKSIVAAKDIKNGQKITKDMITIKRPGVGIQPKDYDLTIGQIAVRDIPQDTIILPTDIHKIKIVYVSGTRADYGLMRETLIKLSKVFDLTVIVTGMHLIKEHGYTYNEVAKDKEYFKVVKGNPTMIKILKPNMLIVLGDRKEMLDAATVATYSKIPIVHIHGGEVTSTVDEHARHAITKLAQIHLVATQSSAERIYKMGENKESIFVVGAPGLDVISNIEPIPFDKPPVVVLHHPDGGESGEQMKIILKAVRETKLPTMIIYPNNDSGSKEIIEQIKGNEDLFIYIRSNISHNNFIGLLKSARCIVGNSSSGLIEAPNCGCPCINIGSRQNGRLVGDNVTTVDYDKDQIKQAILTSKRRTFVNPYGDGKTADRIVNILKNIEIKLQKTMRY